MKPLYTQEQFTLAKSKDLLPCQCYQCDKVFYKNKCNIQLALSPNHSDSGKYCSQKCYHNSRTGVTYTQKNKKKVSDSNVNCLICNKTFKKLPSKIKKYPRHFCSKSCAAIYNSKNRTTGNRRSKLEVYLEEQLTLLYPNLHIDYNKTSAINAELDIYIPSLRLAFEINGIFHYEPIFGDEKLNKTQFNDTRKFKACVENNISLCIIDSTQLKYFKPDNAKKYLDIITNIIKSKN